jgi:signal transduction histidine kinase
VTVRYRPHTVELEVTNGAAGNGVESAFGRPSTDSDRPSGRSGQGLQGMKERVALYGGVFEAGPRAGGFRVLAAFPTDPP